jgi:ATP-dependent RNA helicase SUPV3L1/SUV3
LDRTDGDIDTLSNRINQVRTCTFIANRNDWLIDPEHWQGVARQVEDSLSDALHARLTQRFVDRRTSVLMRRLRENTMLEAEVTSTGQVMVEGHHVGSLLGFCFTSDPQAAGEEAKTLNAAAQKALASEIEARAKRVHEAVDEAFVLANDGVIRWLGEAVGKISAGDHILKPRVRVLADETLSGAQLEMVQTRLDLWLAQHIKKLLGALDELEAGEGLEGVARGIAFQIAESLGVLERSRVSDDMKTLPQEGRAALRKFGVRFGAYHLYLPLLLKPAPRALAAQLWALTHGGLEAVKGLDEVPHLAASGRTSFAADPAVNKGLYRAAGFRVCGERAVRVDILERLADLIRPAIAYRPGTTPGEPPAGTADGEGFVVTVAMTSLAGCSGESFATILKSLGYASEQRPGPAITVPLLPKAAMEPIAQPAPAEVLDAAPEAAAEGEAVAEAPVEAAPETVEVLAGEAAVEAEVPVEAEAAEIVAQEPVAEAVEEVAVEQAEALEPEAETFVAAEDSVAEIVETPAEAPEVSAEAAEGLADAVEASAESAEPVAEVEVALIEVWRPHRQPHHGRRHERGGDRNQDRNRGRRPQGGRSDEAPAVVEGQPVVAAEAGAEGQERPRRDNRPHQGNRSQDGRPQEGRREGRSGEGRSGENRSAEGGKPRFEGRKFDGKRRDEGRNAPAQERNFSSEKRPVREKQADPDSPFAKLAALKAELEAKNKKG